MLLVLQHFLLLKLKNYFYILKWLKLLFWKRTGLGFVLDKKHYKCSKNWLAAAGLNDALGLQLQHSNSPPQSLPKSIHGNQVSLRGWTMKWKWLNYYDINILLVSWAIVTLYLVMGQSKYTRPQLITAAGLSLLRYSSLPFLTTTHPLCMHVPLDRWHLQLYLFTNQHKCPVFEQVCCCGITPCVTLKQT